MGMTATRREWRAIIPEMELAFDFLKGEHVEAVSVKARRQIIGRKQIDSRRKTCFGTNLQQALDNFQGCEHSHRVSVGCHEL